MPTVQNDPMFTHRPVPTEDTLKGSWHWPAIGLAAVILALLFVMLTHVPRGPDHRVMSQTMSIAAETR